MQILSTKNVQKLVRLVPRNQKLSWFTTVNFNYLNPKNWSHAQNVTEKQITRKYDRTLTNNDQAVLLNII